MPTQKIVHWWTGNTLFECEADDIREAIEKAVAHGVSLDGARLDGARLDGARLDGASLDGASLDGASLDRAILDGASLVGAILVRASLVGANLDGAILDGASLDGVSLDGAILDGASLDGVSLDGARLDGASLVGARLVGARLVGARLDGAKINWTSHELVAEILARAAGEDVEKLKIAGIILLQRRAGWCWQNFLAIDDPLKAWAIDSLAPWVRDGDGAPKLLAERARQLKMLSEIASAASGE